MFTFGRIVSLRLHLHEVNYSKSFGMNCLCVVYIKMFIMTAAIYILYTHITFILLLCLFLKTMRNVLLHILYDILVLTWQCCQQFKTIYVVVCTLLVCYGIELWVFILTRRIFLYAMCTSIHIKRLLKRKTFGNSVDNGKLLGCYL